MPILIALLCVFLAWCAWNAYICRNIRNISVLVYLESENCVDWDLIEPQLNEAFREFRRNFLINFRIQNVGLYDGRIMELMNSQHRITKGRSEDVIICFSNSEEIMNDDKLYGYANYDVGVGVCCIFSCTYLIQAKDLGRNSALATMLKHELAHLFVREYHHEDENSLMFKFPVKSRGFWDSHTIDLIKKNKHATWKA